MRIKVISLIVVMIIVLSVCSFTDGNLKQFDGYNYTRPTMISLPDGTLFSVYPASNLVNAVGEQWMMSADIYKSVSTDNGSTWSAPEIILNRGLDWGIYGCASLVFDSSNGTLFCAFGKYYSMNDCYLNIIHSHDMGLTWSLPPPPIEPEPLTPQTKPVSPPSTSVLPSAPGIDSGGLLPPPPPIEPEPLTPQTKPVPPPSTSVLPSAPDGTDRGSLPPPPKIIQVDLEPVSKDVLLPDGKMQVTKPIPSSLMSVEKKVSDGTGFVQKINLDGEIEYYLNGKKLSQSEFDVMINQMWKAGINPAIAFSGGSYELTKEQRDKIIEDYAIGNNLVDPDSPDYENELPEGVNEQSLCMALWDDTIGYIPLETTINTEKNTLEVYISCFGKYAIIVIPECVEIEQNYELIYDWVIFYYSRY